MFICIKNLREEGKNWRFNATCTICGHESGTWTRNCLFLLRWNIFFSEKTQLTADDVMSSMMHFSPSWWGVLGFSFMVLHKLHSVWFMCNSNSQERMCCLQLSCIGTNPKVIDFQKSHHELIFFQAGRSHCQKNEVSLDFVKCWVKTLFCNFMSCP
jgi:hypothetical protein